MSYKHTKNLNFAKIYGAGLRKMALMMEFVTQAEYLELLDDPTWRNHPKLASLHEIDAIYKREIPEAEDLLNRARKLAESRGYVRTALGRRSRFPGGYRSHKSLNAVIQGDAADVMKRKLVELHAARHHTQFTLRFTVHDEVDGDAREPDTAAKVRDVLNTQSFPTKIPILWDVSTGATWKDC